MKENIFEKCEAVLDHICCPQCGHDFSFTKSSPNPLIDCVEITTKCAHCKEIKKISISHFELYELKDNLYNTIRTKLKDNVLESIIRTMEEGLNE